MKKILFIVLLLFVQQVFAVDATQHYDPDHHYFGVSASFGSGTLLPGYCPFELALAANWQYKNHIYQIRKSGLFEYSTTGPTPGQYVHDLSILYGWCHRDDVRYRACSVGLGYVNGVKRGKFLQYNGECDEYEKVVFETLGLSFQVESFLLTPVVGLGVQLLGNVNPKQSYIAFALSLQVGYLLGFGRN